ncbi:MAG TPA: hypothetical protein VD736_07680 [Nitrososphaera sp.]|nr:hypothetical protein [Nitrososphaera sp.]
MKIALLLVASLLVLSFLVFIPCPALAHEEVEYGDIRISAGWLQEPPLVGQLNEVVLEVTRVSDDQPITNALAQMDISIKKGAPTKSLDYEPQEEPGVYAAEILPTQTGQYVVVLKGTIAGQAIDDQIQIEDVEDTARFAFPAESGGISDEAIRQLQTVITDLTEQVDEANIAAQEAKDAAQSATELKNTVDSAFLFGMIGIGVGVAGIAIGVAAMRREKV